MIHDNNHCIPEDYRQWRGISQPLGLQPFRATSRHRGQQGKWFRAFQSSYFSMILHDEGVDSNVSELNFQNQVITYKVGQIVEVKAKIDLF